MRIPTVVKHVGLAVAAGAVLLTVSANLAPYPNYLLATVAAYVCATAGLTILTGLNGQLSLGHGAFMAIGAYVVAFTQRWFRDHGGADGGTLAWALVLAVLLTTVAGLGIGLAAARLRGPYLAGVTLAVAIAVPAVTTAFAGVFNGEQGLDVYGTRRPRSLALSSNEQWRAWVAVVAALIVLVLLANLVRGGFGRSMRAVRDDEVAAALAGIPIARTQVLTFMVSAAAAGLGGGVIAVATQAATPGAYPLELSLFLVVAIVVGGLGSLAGAVWGALVVVLLPEVTEALTDRFPLSAGLSERLHGNLPHAVLGLVLVVVMIAAPGGLQHLFRRAFRWSRSRRPRSAPL